MAGLPTFSYPENGYVSSGAVLEQAALIPPSYASSFAAFQGGSISTKGTSVNPRPVFTTFLPFAISSNGVTNEKYISNVRTAIPVTNATLNFHNGPSATLSQFQTQLDKVVDAVGFIGHSNLDPVSSQSIGLCFKDNIDPKVQVNCTIASQYVDLVGPPTGTRFTQLDSFSTKAKVVFIAACDTRSVFQGLWGIQSSTQGQALVVPDTSVFTGLTDLGHAGAMWEVIMSHLAFGDKLADSVAAGNQNMQSLGFSERWKIIGDANVAFPKPSKSH
jgi:hypothetical protein